MVSNVVVVDVNGISVLSSVVVVVIVDVVVEVLVVVEVFVVILLVVSISSVVDVKTVEVNLNILLTSTLSHWTRESKRL